ncbi:MAG: T9SS type A sorting domain-containing protein [Bacteroidota bacterium]
MLLFLSYFGQAQTFAGESVEYDSTGNRFFRSSDGMSIVQRAANGTISYFGSNLDADFGMEVMGNTLFAITGSQIKGYDLTTEMEVMSISIGGAQFLNGLTNDGTSKLYATDFSAQRIYEIDVTSFVFPSFTTIVSNTGSTPNGIVYDGANNRCIFVSWGSNADIKAVDLSTFAVTTLVSTTLSNIDGIDEDNQGNYYISSWSPTRISRYDANFTNPADIITAPGINNPADICYARKIDTLAIPNGNNTVTFVGFTPMTSVEAPAEGLDFAFGPNPVGENGWVEFELTGSRDVKLEVVGLDGRHVRTLIAETLQAGRHKVLLSGTEIPAGTYLCRMQADDEVRVRKFVKID